MGKEEEEEELGEFLPNETSFQQFLSSWMVQIIVFGLKLWICTLLVEGRRDISQEGCTH